LFDSYTAKAGNSVASDYKTCDISIPVTVPQGYQVSVTQVDYRGFNDLPLGGNSKLSVEYFLAGSKTAPQTASFEGPLQENYLVRHAVDSNKVTWSYCSRDVTFRINSSIWVKTNMLGESAMTTVDSTDLALNPSDGKHGVVLYLQWNPCLPPSSGASALVPPYALVPALVAMIAALSW